MSNEPNPRSSLREAISQNAEALSNLRNAERLLARAHDLHCMLIAKRAEQFDSLDAEISTARANLVKQALDSDDNAHLLTKSVEGHAAKLLARENIDFQIQGVADSIPTLESELAEVRLHAEETENAIELAREKVFCAEAEELAQDFLQKLNELRAMSHQLRFMAARQVRIRRPENKQNNAPIYWGNEQHRKIAMKGFVIGACYENIMGDSDLHGNIKVRERVAQAINTYWNELRQDPDAEFDPTGETTRRGVVSPVNAA